MKRSTAVSHLVRLVDEVPRVNDHDVVGTPRDALVEEVWAFGPVLDDPAAWDEGFVSAAMVVDVAPEEAAWFGRTHPTLLGYWGLDWEKRPLSLFWRSSRAPVWNHHIRRPVLLWSRTGGDQDEALRDLRDGRPMDPHRLPEPSHDEWRERLHEEQEVNLRALESATKRYDDLRWGRGKVMPAADALWEVAAGLVDLRQAERAAATLER